MSEFEKRMVRLNGGLTVSIESKEDEAEFIEALQQVSKKNGPFTTALFSAWAEGVGKEIKGSNFCLLAEAEFLFARTLDDVRRVNLESLKRIFEDEEEVRRELDRRMQHYVETSEGVIWIGN